MEYLQAYRLLDKILQLYTLSDSIHTAIYAIIFVKMLSFVGDIVEKQFSIHSSHLLSNRQYAYKANDGNTTTCSHTMEVHRSTAAPWWRVWFSQNQTIQEIYVLTKTDILQCPVNKWGPLCEYSCGACRISTCDVVKGTCYGGCRDGFENTDFCTTECIYGRYSFGCCSVNCMTQPCNKVNGECIGGCKDGYRGNRCEQECMDGTYGIGCNIVCSVHCANVCNKVTGTCSCKAGYKGILCDEECDRGTFGTDCTSQCNSKCPNTCDKVTGHCSECPLGWKGHYCETECDYGTYGLNCTADCGHCQTNTFCHKVTGICESGCMKGYTGATCHDAEEDPEVPTPVPIAMIAGTSVGVVAIICVTVVVVCVVMYKKRQLQSTSSTTKGQMEPATNSISSSYVNLQRNDRMNDTTYETINP